MTLQKESVQNMTQWWSYRFRKTGWATILTLTLLFLKYLENCRWEKKWSMHNYLGGEWRPFAKETTGKDDKFMEKSFPEEFLGSVRGIVALRAPHQLKYLNNCRWSKKWTTDSYSMRDRGAVRKETD